MGYAVAVFEQVVRMTHESLDSFTHPDSRGGGGGGGSTGSPHAGQIAGTSYLGSANQTPASFSFKPMT